MNLVLRIPARSRKPIIAGLPFRSYPGMCGPSPRRHEPAALHLGESVV